MEGGIEVISMSIIKDKRISFCDIVTNPDYYEVTEDKKEKDFFTCANEGFIPKIR